MADWSDSEVEVIVADYFSMLREEIAGGPYSKAEHRRRIKPLLHNRPDGSIEYKHQNISAVLIKFGAPYILGYKPRWNYQKRLEHVVSEYLKDNPNMDISFETFANGQDIKLTTPKISYSEFLDSTPQPKAVKEPREYYRSPVELNYLEVEQNNRLLGISGDSLKQARIH